MTDKGRYQLDELKEMNFDFMMMDMHVIYHKLAEYLEIPFMFQHFYLPHHGYYFNMQTPTQHAYTMPLGLSTFEYAEKWGFNNVVDKTREMFLYFAIPFVLSKTYMNESALPSHL